MSAPTASREEPQNSRSRFDRIKDFGRNNKRTLGITGAGAGAAAILAGILGTGNQEEEEQY